MIKSKLTTSFQVLGAACMFALSATAQAQITSFSDDFESYGTAGTPSVALFNPPWQGFSDNCGFPGGYVFDPSTSGPQISALGYNGVDNQYWNVYANYDNAPCHTGSGPNAAEEIFVFKEFDFTAVDTANGGAWVYTFSYRESDVPPAGATETAAYIRVFDPVFNILFETELNTRGVGSTWTDGKLVLPIDPGWVSGKVQIGFRNKTQAYQDSGVFYDDVNFVQAADTPVNVKSFGPGGNTIHPEHDGGPGAINGLDDVIRVNVLGQSTTVGDPTNFDAADIDESTVRFGRDQADTSNGLLQQTGTVDVDSDGIQDSQYRFFVSESGITCDDTAVVVTGELSSTGETFSGTADNFITGRNGGQCNNLCHN